VENISKLWPLRLLRIFCPEQLYEEIEGDLIQRFDKDVRTVGRQKAKRKLLWNVIRFFRPGILLRNQFSIKLIQMMMLQNYFKTAWRNIVRNKVYSFINVCGLAVGMAAFFLIIQYINFETSYDQFHENKNTLYRIITTQKTDHTAGTFVGTSFFLKEHFPEVKHVVPFFKWPANTGVILSSNNKVFNERNYFFTGPEFFEVFSSLLQQGDAASCLKNPNSVVLSNRMAMKIFGTTDVVGKEIANLNRDVPQVITGVMLDLPENSHFDADVIIPMEGEWVPDKEYYWKYPNWWTYITIDEKTDVKDLELRINDAIAKDQKDNPEVKDTYANLQSINDIHFSPPLQRDIKPAGNRTLVYALTSIAIIILLLAWINYINLETSRLITRTKEVGIRRIVGSAKSELILQFFIQYTCVNTLAAIVACMLVYISMPYYQYITGVPVTSVGAVASWIWITAFALFIMGTLISGIYPAVLLARFNPAQSLKGKLGNISKPVLRRSLLSFQFVSSITLMAFLFVIFQQLDFMRNSNTNMSLDRILTVYNPTNYTSKENSTRKKANESFRNKLIQHSGIARLSTSSVIPGEPVGFTYVDLAKRSLDDRDRQVPYKVIYIDYDFIPMYGIKLKAGRNYAEASGDHLSLVVSESTIRELGFKSAEEAIDQEIYFMEDEWEKWKIIGVVEDYRHESVKSPIYPTIFRLHRNKGQMVYYSMQLNEGISSSEAIAFAEKTWKETWPEKPFDYFFMDQYYDKQYKAEVHFSRVFGLFTIVAALLACLGILGLTLFEANARLKEISIRKVLGASASSLVALLSRDHIRILSTSFLLATPLIFFVAKEWLSTYAVRVTISPIVFLLPLGIILLIVILTSGFQTVKAANANPVDHLKNE